MLEEFRELRGPLHARVQPGLVRAAAARAQPGLEVRAPQRPRATQLRAPRRASLQCTLRGSVIVVRGKVSRFLVNAGHIPASERKTLANAGTDTPAVVAREVP